MSNGKVEQIDTPEKIYDQPATAFVADFMGNANRLQARFADGQVWIGDLPFGNGVNAGGEGDATAFVRAHEFVLAKEEEPALAARIEHILRAGPMAQIDARLLESDQRSKEHTSELQSLMRISYAVFCLKKKKKISVYLIPYDTT